MQSEVSRTWKTLENKVEELRPKLLDCHVRNSHINQRDRSLEDNVKVADIIIGYQWVEEVLIPEIKKRDRCYAELPTEAWEYLNFFDEENEHQKTLDRLSRNVRTTWAKRPDILRKTKKYGRKRTPKSRVSGSIEKS